MTLWRFCGVSKLAVSTRIQSTERCVIQPSFTDGLYFMALQIATTETTTIVVDLL